MRQPAQMESTKWVAFEILVADDLNLVIELEAVNQRAWVVVDVDPQDYILPYFWRNFSTRPAVSTIFCLPV